MFLGLLFLVLTDYADNSYDSLSEVKFQEITLMDLINSAAASG
jgi:hypothetical protein